ncbi:transmembrane protein 32 family protein [Acanthamoeba castellanii str. Neff]|uniref:Transmembrane protein 32 family protein n=1 Tax=Acanthamoeba castellanii (strain ATCC 30010 / Neff) TaxID=1257118 RepID=L8GF04_ACACF|nr:transmembrane protein 32 family protein [Acanthamoeba castellanii str. Neff]ELR11640.1 transmembrane protein 32 family protein [Acanthamoeba castellanii str. Neff]
MNSADKGRLIAVLGFALLLHSAYSATQYRNYLRIMETPTGSLPLDITFECVASVVLCAYGSLLWAGTLLPIRLSASLMHRTFDAAHSRTEFQTFNHRHKWAC